MNECIYNQTIEVGRLLCGSVRRELEAAQARGDIMAFVETSGFLSRDFVVRGTKGQLYRVKRALSKYED